MGNGIIICPKCKKYLKLYKNSLICDNGHCFDISSKGYVNLILGNATTHGDNTEMVEVRKRFLTGGYYLPFAEKICESVVNAMTDGSVYVDCGCGEGYYTDIVERGLSERKISHTSYAYDISKTAVIAAAKKNKGIHFLVASSNALPFADLSVDVMTCIFSPLAITEFSRVLKCGGTLILAIPMPRHLYSLKCAVYDTPYENKPLSYELDGYRMTDIIQVKNVAHLKTNREISDLFTMTPYYYKTSEKDRNKLKNIDCLDVETEFEILIYKKLQS